MSEQLLPTPCTFGDNGNFLLERELGRGGMGGVYMGRDKMLDRPVAVKVMLKEYGADAAFVERFKKEAQAAAKLIHPNIAQIYSYGISDGMPYIAMELVAGGSLWTVMQAASGKPDVTRVLKICQQVAQALQCSTDQGFVHGDIKPENILLDANGNAKLVDFGLAGMQKDTSEIWGTPYYIAPEKVQQAGVDFRADMYNLGGTLYHALTNTPPFDGPDVNAVVRSRFFDTPKKPSELRADLTPAVDDLVMRMLERDKEKRFPSFEALIAEFKKVLTSGLEVKEDAAKAGGEGAPAAKATPAGTKTVRRTTTMRTGRRMTTVHRRTATTIKTVDQPADPDTDSPKEEAEEEESGGNLGVRVAAAIVGGLLLIGAVIGGLVWFKVAAKHAEEAAYQAQITDKIARAREAIANNRLQAIKFADEFDGFANKAVSACKTTTDELKKLLPDWANELQPPPSKELTDAIASTNAVVATPPPAPAPAPAATNAAPAAATTTNAAPAKAAAPAPAAKDAPKPKAEAKSEPAQPAKDEKPRPAVLDDMTELWNRTYSCQASAVRIRHQARQIVKLCDSAETLKGQDENTLKQLADLATKTTDAVGEIRMSKDVENVRKGISFIKDKGDRAVKSTIKRLRIEKLEADRHAAKEREIAEEKAKHEAAEAAKRKVIDEETAAAKDKFEALVAQGVFTGLNWDDALRQLKAVKDACTTAEGEQAAKCELHKVEAMKKVQDIFRENLPGYTFRKGSKKGGLKGCTVRKVDASQIEVAKPDKKSVQKLTWRKFYKDYHGNLNELINNFVVKGRDNGRRKLNLEGWADAMSGAALTMRIICGDSPSAAAYGETLVKQVAEAFPDYQRNLKAMFPDIKFGGEEESASEDSADKTSDDEKDDEKAEEKAEEKDQAEESEDKATKAEAKKPEPKKPEPKKTTKDGGMKK